MDYDIGEDLEPNVLAAAVEGCNVARASYKRCMEDIATCQKGMHPYTTKGFGHDAFGVFDSGVFRMLGGLFCFADIFAVPSVIGHPPATIRWTRFCPPPMSIWEALAPALVRASICAACCWACCCCCRAWRIWVSWAGERMMRGLLLSRLL